jgi:secreted trypsin-like serine protease
MSARIIINTAVAIAFVSFFASCAPSSSDHSAQNFGAQTSGSNIIGGVDSSADYQKTNGIVGLLMIYQNSSGDQMSSVCTGSLIAQNVLVTAAHCLVKPSGVQLVAALVFFDKNLETIMNEVSQKDLTHVRNVNKAFRHEAYLQGRGTYNDIGLVRFEGTAPDGFQLAQLADAQTARTLRKGAAVTLAGFGVSKYQMDRKTGKPVGSGDGVLRSISGIKVLSLTSTGQEITLDQSLGRGACHGDSGGPAYIVDQVTRKTLLVGVTSRGTNPQGLCDRQAIYTSVMGYGQWITDGLQKMAAQ